LIYGLAAFLVTSAWTSRNLKSALVALAVIFLYGGIVWGLLPGTPGVSWEGHLCGAIAGFLVARMARAQGRARLP
jgi:membrane associated rhomboid family serine protease